MLLSTAHRSGASFFHPPLFSRLSLRASTMTFGSVRRPMALVRIQGGSSSFVCVCGDVRRPCSRVFLSPRYQPFFISPSLCFVSSSPAQAARGASWTTAERAGAWVRAARARSRSPRLASPRLVSPRSLARSLTLARSIARRRTDGRTDSLALAIVYRSTNNTRVRSTHRVRLGTESY